MSEIGRWASLQTLWIYVTDALAEIAAYKTEPSAWALLERESLRMRTLVRG